MRRSEYPRPQFVRKEWLCLNGTWDFSFDDQNLAAPEHWERDSCQLERKIEVPFCFESSLSGIRDTSIHDRVFYKRKFSVPDSWLGRRILLHFEAVDYQCRVFVNERLCAEHRGGNCGFCVDITDELRPGEQSLAVAVYDPARDETIPRGKQYWEEKSAKIWYTRTTGIWQSVWLEPVSDYHITQVRFTPDIDHDTVLLEADFSDFTSEMYLETQISFRGELICQDCFLVNNGHIFQRGIHLAKDHIFYRDVHDPCRYWSPENPALYDVKLCLKVSGRETDRADSYFGMRKIHTENGITYLNNRPYYFKMVLDQGYWRDGILTAPDDEDFKTDIRLMKEMGFNGCRKHQKVEDARFLYHADTMGLLVWGEMASPCLYTDQGVRDYAAEWFEIIKRDYNHPSIVTWVLFNESWGLPNLCLDSRQQCQTMGMYYLVKSLDPTRLVISNDGWEMTKSDICAIHNYNHGSGDESAKQDFFKSTLQEKNLLLSCTHAGRSVYAKGYSYGGEPILVTECGGINYQSSRAGSWGYTSADSEQDFLSQYEHVVRSVFASDLVYGFCYTQLTDVEQETNGLLTYERTPKCQLSKLRAINESYRHNIVLND
ncbi:MAG: glycoside hydrolase family 2 [Lachnospiraceae bacterium]|nr:glycoside hydrolase family 2 [Lachnospiraceae bacterium]